MLCSDWGPVHLGHTARADRSVKRGFCPPYLTMACKKTKNPMDFSPKKDKGGR